ncbi:ribbon-helix-helix domain-containing protein [Oerskovia flava]|uniref:ribbon-helix-helix domain-containing protein n=1 Tax=Oerskovia flava TaxID=2986422 RepID=UPI00224011EC|nr:ribbon-helix-helix domain-containing protein [Oerskovia sp. JB1-3-2]
MGEQKVNGQGVSDEQIQAWADEAEAGYDVSRLRRRGRPSAGEGPGRVVPVRLDARTLAALNERAQAEGLMNRSEAIRAAVRAWAHVACGSTTRQYLDLLT